MSTSAKNLTEFCQETLAEILKIRDRVRSERQKRGYVEKADFLAEIRKIVTNSEGSVLSGELEKFEIQFVDRAQFAADVTFRSTELIRTDKNRYLTETCPALAKTLASVQKDGVPLFENVEQKGIYVNAKFAPEFLFSALSAVESQGEKFGEGSVGKDRDVVIDYSSPNAAKHLHAGHIRSTIIGHVLGNLYEAVGYSVHRINYLNDWGGMGFLLEGLSRRADDAEKFENKNDFLFEIYSAFRKGQKFSASAEEFARASEKDLSDLVPIFGNCTDVATLKTAFDDFKTKSDSRFSALESGDSAEFANWRKIVEWSLADFERFYAILDVHQEYLAGESLYSGLGKTLIREAVTTWEVVKFDRKRADAEIAELAQMRDREELTTETFEKLKAETEADIGGYVIELSNRQRYVVLKGNESTIYATRDLAALKHRAETFEPVKIVYEVGQEQQDHFAKLFESGRKLGFAEGIKLEHVYHGFYVNEETKKKLSSRDGASNILKLLSDTVAYFEAKYDGSTEFSDEEKRRTARALGVGSIVFNDLKRDKKSSIGISADTEKMMRSFEESGGAYVVYASCRAKSILRKYGKPTPKIREIAAIPGAFSAMLDSEADLVKKILEFGDVVEKAALGDDSVRVTEYLLKLSALYNAYYHAVPVLKGENIEARIALAAAVARVIDNGLTLLHIETVERI